MSIVLYGIQFPQVQIEDWINSINHCLDVERFWPQVWVKKAFQWDFSPFNAWPKFQLFKLFQKNKFKDLNYFLDGEMSGKVQPRARETETPPDEINSGERKFRLPTELHQKSFTHAFLFLMITQRRREP